MNTVTRPFRGTPVRLVLAFAKASLVLEWAVQDLLRQGWDEDARRVVQQMAGALRQTARRAGWWDRESALRAIESILALSPSEVLPIRKAIGDKLLELLAYSMNVPTCRSA
jgi:hypothetical protein